MRGVAIYARDGAQEWTIERGTPEHEESMEWARFHGLDPMRIPAESVIERDAPGRRILFTEFVYDPPESRDVTDLVVVDGEAVTVDRVEQGEAPPLPFPWTRR